MGEVEAYISEQEEPVQELMLYLHRFLVTFPGLTPKLRYKIPFYDRKSWVCYLNPVREGRVELAFTRANELSNEQGLLTFGSRSQVAGVTWGHIREIPLDALSELIGEALLLDESVRYSTKRKQ